MSSRDSQGYSNDFDDRRTGQPTQPWGTRGSYYAQEPSSPTDSRRAVAEYPMDRNGRSERLPVSEVSTSRARKTSSGGSNGAAANYAMHRAGSPERLPVSSALQPMVRKNTSNGAVANFPWNSAARYPELLPVPGTSEPWTRGSGSNAARTAYPVRSGSSYPEPPVTPTYPFETAAGNLNPTRRPDKSSQLLTVPNVDPSRGRNRDQYEDLADETRPKSILRRSLSRGSPSPVTSARDTARNTRANSGDRRLSAEEANRRDKEQHERDLEEIWRLDCNRQWEEEQASRMSSQARRPSSPRLRPVSTVGRSSQRPTTESEAEDRGRGSCTSATDYRSRGEILRSDRNGEESGRNRASADQYGTLRSDLRDRDSSSRLDGGQRSRPSSPERTSARGSGHRSGTYSDPYTDRGSSRGDPDRYRQEGRATRRTGRYGQDVKDKELLEDQSMRRRSRQFGFGE